jgi:putative membrane protein
MSAKQGMVGTNFLHGLSFFTNTCYMKKTFVLPVLIAASVLTSCGDNNDSSANTTTTTTDTTTSMNNAPATTDTTASAANRNTTPLNESDQAFVKKAAMGGMMEVQTGQLAQQNAMNQRVKDFGAMMVRDHGAANQELMTLARNRGLMLSDSLDKKMQDHITAMQKMTGKSFDQHYITMMRDDHNKDIAEFEKAASGANDPELKAWAAKTLPTLKVHRDSVMAISKGMK